MKKYHLEDDCSPSKAYQKLFKHAGHKRIRKNPRLESFKKHLLRKRIEAYTKQIEEEQKAFRQLAFEKLKPIFKENDNIFFKRFKTWQNDKELQNGYPNIFKAFTEEADRRQDLEYQAFLKYLDKNNHKLRHITFIDYE
jgi:hypothetical protein